MAFYDSLCCVRALGYKVQRIDLLRLESFWVLCQNTNLPLYLPLLYTKSISFNSFDLPLSQLYKFPLDKDKKDRFVIMEIILYVVSLCIIYF